MRTCNMFFLGFFCCFFLWRNEKSKKNIISERCLMRTCSILEGWGGGGGGRVVVFLLLFF